MRLTSGLFALGLLLPAACGDDDSPPDPEPSHEWQAAFDAEATGWLLNVWGPAADDLYAVGGTPDEGVVMRYDGEAWTELDLGVDVPLLNWAYGFGPDDITLVGNQGTILHWDGSSWETQSTTVTEDIWGVWGAAPDDLWAVGGRGRAEGQDTVLRYDGTAWRKVKTPELQRPGVWAFFKVWGTGPDNVYIVGQRGAVLHWDGAVLTEQLVGTSEDLISLWGTGPDRIAIVGGRNNGQVVTWNGSEWRHESLAPLPGLNGIWMRSPDVLHVAGVSGTLAAVDFETLEYTDETQTEVNMDFHAVFGDPSGKLTTVGGNFLMPDGPYRGVAYERELRDEE